MPELKFVPLNQIRQNKVALRDVNRQGEEFLELAQSIRNQGVLSAISLRRIPGDDGKEYQLVDGLQRWTASNEVGTGVVELVPDPNNPDRKIARGTYVTVPGSDGKEIQVGVIPAMIIERDEADTMLAQMIGNAHRVETRPTEYAKTIIKYLGYNPTLTVNDLAARLGKSTPWIDKTMTLNKLADALKPLVDDGHIKLANAYNLVKLPPEEQLLWAERAQTESAEQFTPACLARAKEIRDAHRKGQEAGTNVFEPQMHIRKKLELESEAKTPTVGPALIRELDITKDMPSNAQGRVQAAIAGFQLGVNWVLNFDPKSIEAQKAKNDQKALKEADDKKRREAEKTKKQEEEALKRAEAARVASAAAQQAAAGLPPAPERKTVPLSAIAQAELDAQKAGEKLEPVA